MATLTQVVGAIVHNNRSSKNGVGTNQLDKSILLGTLGNTLRVSDDVTQVTNVSVLVLWGTMGLTKGVEVGAGGSTAVGVVTKSVDVETSQGVRVISGDFPGNNRGLCLGGLLERDDTGDFLVTSDNCN